MISVDEFALASSRSHIICSYLSGCFFDEVGKANGGMDGTHGEPQFPTLQVIVTIGTITVGRAAVQHKDWVSFYETDGLSIREIARRSGFARATISKYLKQVGIALGKWGGPRQKKSQPAYGERNVKGKTIRHESEAEVAHRIRELREQNLSLRQIGRILKRLGLHSKSGGDISHPEIVRRICARKKLCETT